MNLRVGAAILWAAGLAAATPVRADIVFLNNGDEVPGRVASVSADKVVLEEKSGRRDIPKADIQKLKLVKEFRVPGEDKASLIKDPVVRAALAKPPKAEAYPDDGSYVFLQESTFVLRKDGTSAETVRSVRTVLRERGKDESGNVRVPYLAGLEKASIGWARAIAGDQVYYLDDTSVQDASEYYYVPPYDRLRSVKFSVPNVDTGTTVDYSYTVESSSAGREYPFFGEVFFRGYEPMAVVRLKVIVPKAMRLKYVEAGLPENAVFKETLVAPAGGSGAFKESKAGDYRQYVWETKNVPSFRREENRPPFARMAPRVSFCVQDDWGAIRRQLGEAAARLTAGPELKAKTAELLAPVPAGPDGRKDPVRAAQALYGWVAKEIKYVGIDMDQYGYLPKPPDEVFRAKMGNSLDKPFLLYAMLKEAGLQADFLYVKDKGSAPFMADLPSVRQFTTGAVLANLGGRRMVLAPLADTRRMGENPGSLQDVWSLKLGSDDDPFFETPLRDESMESTSERTSMELDEDGSAVVRTEYSFRGSDQSDYRGLKDMKKEELDKWVEQVVHSIHPNAALVGYELEGVDDLAKDLRLAYRYRIPDFALKAGTKFLVFKVPGLDYAASEVGEPARELPLFWLQRHLTSHQVSIRLPKGYRVYHLPKDAAFRDEAGSYRARYSSREGTVFFEDALARRATDVAPEDYAKYKSFREAVAKFGEEWLVLAK